MTVATQVSFYTGMPERLLYLCRLLRKAQRAGSRVGVCGPESLLLRLDAKLWDFEPAEFVPHGRLGAEGVVAERTPILLTEHAQSLPHRELLLNIGPDVPEGFDQFERVLEVVSQDPAQVQAGRRRFKQYEALGFAVTHHKVAA
ncbi:DNA polymerase III subunit chi [Roseateles koreensis]|uniref:DNA polymerase III subunit chi n=1 Tax=Roseateles koreensis TaxID=2987526 RepID=A0ABT5KNE5_9BURK|nr:DNA polymerase III subunit chi [Roseateles koreensis]MDC8784439.1 DNA polymerase III subunit chi [Roseateles koreensis]